MTDRLPGPSLALALACYAVQGVVFAYFINFNPGYMAAGGAPESSIATIQTLALLPFILKFLAAPLSDRFPLLGLGHRRPYILIGLITQMAGLAGLASIGPPLAGPTLTIFAALAVLTVAGLALYDTCVDGLVVDQTPPADRSRVQGLLMFSRFATATAFSIGFGHWLDRTGTGPGAGQGVLWACAGLSAVPLVLAGLTIEPPRTTAVGRFDWRALGVMVRPRSLALIAFGVFYAVISYGVEINLPTFYDRLDYGPAAIGGFGAARNLGRAAGALMLPVALGFLGRRWTLRLAVLALAATEAAQGLGQAGAGPLVGLLSFLFGAANGWAEAMFYVLAMEAADPRLAASTYALFMAASNVSVTGGFFFDRLVTAVDGRYPPAFALAGAFSLLALAMLGPLGQPPTAIQEDRSDADLVA